MVLTIDNVEHVDGVPVEVRKGRNARHIMVAAPGLFASFEARGICGQMVGVSSDDAVQIGADLTGGKVCQRCGRVYFAMLDAQETPAPAPAQTLPSMSSEAREIQRRADAVAAHYAAGHPVPDEIASLPDPAIGKGQWDGGNSRRPGAFMVCPFRGSLATDDDPKGDLPLNRERTHGKCPGCSAYIPLAPEKPKKRADGSIILNRRGEVVTDGISRLGKHYGGGVLAAPGKGLASRSVDIVDHGSVPGSPADADKRLRKQIATHYGQHDKLAEPVFRPNGSSYVHGRETAVTFRGDHGAGQRGHGTADGAAVVARHNLPPVRPKRGWIATAGTSALSMTTSAGIDPVVGGTTCPVCKDLVEIAHRGKSHTWRRRHSVKVKAWHRKQDAEQEAARARTAVVAEAEANAEAAHARKEQRKPRFTIAPVTAQERKALRKAASIGRSVAGTIATTGTIVHAPHVA